MCVRACACVGDGTHVHHAQPANSVRMCVEIMAVVQGVRQYDAVVFGATGFTGRRIAASLVALPAAPSARRNLAVAGRQVAKLNTVLADIRAQVSGAEGRFGVIEADVRCVRYAGGQQQAWCTAACSHTHCAVMVIALCVVCRMVADVLCSNYASLVAMARSTRVVLNAVGPFRFFGEAVVKGAPRGRAHTRAPPSRTHALARIPRASVSLCELRCSVH